MNLILLFSADFIEHDLVSLSGERARHIRNIHRADVGKILKVGLVDVGYGEGVIQEVSSDKILMKIRMNSSEDRNKLSPFSQVSLIIALPRPQTLKKVLETAGTFGIRKISFISSERVEKSFFQSTLLKDKNWFRHLYLGMEQGSRIDTPQTSFHSSFRKFMKGLEETAVSKNASRLILHPGSKISLWDTPVASGKSSEVLAAVGPEGGWIDEEVKTFERQGFLPMRLGNTVLRVEGAVTGFLSQLELLKTAHPAISRERRGISSE